MTDMSQDEGNSRKPVGPKSSLTDADKSIREVHRDVLAEERSKAKLNKQSFYFTWAFALTLIVMLLYVACQGVHIVRAEIDFANKYIKANQVCCSNQIPLQNSADKSISKPDVASVDDEASVIASFSGAYGKSLIFLGVLLSILTTAFVTLVLSASKMFLPKPNEKLDPSNGNNDTNYPPLDWVIKVYEAISGKKGS